MTVMPGQLRRWNHPVEGQSDFFVVVSKKGKFVPNGSRAGTPRIDHWELLHDGQISTGWPEDLIMEESIPCKDIT